IRNERAYFWTDGRRVVRKRNRRERADAKTRRDSDACSAQVVRHSTDPTMTILVIIFLGLCLFGRFLVWSAASRTGSFLFLTLIGAFAGGVILWVSIAYVCEIFDLHLYSNTDEMDSVALVEIGSSLVMGLIYACGQVNTKEHQRHFRKMDRMDRQLEALDQQEREALKEDIAAIRHELGPQAT